jgi:hypothetical protein
MTRVRSLIVVLLLSFAVPVAAQESKSAALVKQLTAALDAGKLDSIAAKDPSAPDAFCAALYFPNSQLLVVAAKYAAPQLLAERLTKKEYRDTYIDLSSASVPASKVFVQDAAADGLSFKGFDIYEEAGKTTPFDGDWKKQKISEQDYQKAFAAADERYSQILSALLRQLKPTS